jgi:hypothetical protein
MEKININGKNYQLDINRAKELGVLKSEARPIIISDLKNGNIVRWRQNGIAGSSAKHEGWHDTILIVDITADGPKQGINLDGSYNLKSPTAWFRLTDKDVQFAVLNPKTSVWETTIVD